MTIRSKVGSLAPIALFVFKRPEHTRRTLESLARNAEFYHSRLFIYCDGARNSEEIDQVEKTRDLVRSWPHPNKFVIARDWNWGLASSIIDGVTKIVNEFGDIIVLEDDLVISPYFLQYMNSGLQTYRNDINVASIHGYVYPIPGLPESFFLRGADCWGWATWKTRWAIFELDGIKLMTELHRRGLARRFDFNGAYPFSKMLAEQIAGKNNSWAIRWHASAFLMKKFTLYPGKSLVQNIGFDGTGTHCASTDVFSTDLASKPIQIDAMPVEENVEAFSAFENYFRSLRSGFFSRALYAMRSILWGN